MDTKLTVRVPIDLLENAKRYAKSHNTSLTGLITAFLRHLPAELESLDHAPLVQRLTGILSADGSKEDYNRFLEENMAANSPKVLFDLNIILDVLQARTEFYTAY